jgi:hypothetical protein
MKSIIDDVEEIGARLRDIERKSTPALASENMYFCMYFPDVEAAQNTLNQTLAQVWAMPQQECYVAQSPNELDDPFSYCC